MTVAQAIKNNMECTREMQYHIVILSVTFMLRQCLTWYKERQGYDIQDIIHYYVADKNHKRFLNRSVEVNCAQATGGQPGTPSLLKT